MVISANFINMSLLQLNLAILLNSKLHFFSWDLFYSSVLLVTSTSPVFLTFLAPTSRTRTHPEGSTQPTESLTPAHLLQEWRVGRGQEAAWEGSAAGNGCVTRRPACARSATGSSDAPERLIPTHTQSEGPALPSCRPLVHAASAWTLWHRAQVFSLGYRWSRLPSECQRPSLSPHTERGSRIDARVRLAVTMKGPLSNKNKTRLDNE